MNTEDPAEAFVIYLLSYGPRYGLSDWHLCERPFWSTDIIPACDRLLRAGMITRRQLPHDGWRYRLTSTGRGQILEARRVYRHIRRRRHVPAAPRRVFQSA